MHRHVLWSIVSALAGFLFGFDTIVISGAEQTIRQLWQLTAGEHGLAMGAALYGTVVGSLIGGWPTDRFGRKKTLTWIGGLYLISSIWSALATDVVSFFIARFIGGLGIGISTIAAPMFISEISPPQSRGRLAGMFQFNIVFGILMAYVSNYLLQGLGEQAWRWMLGVMAFPSLIYAVLCFWIPESPRWLLTRGGNREEGLRVLGLIRPEASREELQAAAAEIATPSPERPSWRGFFSRQLRLPILLAFLVAFFNQASGINAILYYAPRLFEMAGLKETALLKSIGIGVTNLIFTFVGLWLIDRLGRRMLLYIGSFGYIASLGLCSWAYLTGHTAIVPLCVFVFIAAHAVGQGAVIWVLISEVFPDRYRAAGQTLGSATHWVFAALIATYFPSALEKMNPGYVFLFFCGMMVLHLLWVRFMVPETKGVPLEEMERKLNLHP